MTPQFFLLYCLAVIAIIIIAFIRKSIKRSNFDEIHKMRKEAGAQKILYLRSFKLDGEGDALNRDILSRMNLMPIEIDLAGQLIKSPYHLVTIGKPEEEIPEIGFDRIYVSDDEWKEKVYQLIQESALIIFRPDSSEAVFWEFEQIFQLNQRKKLLIWAEMGYGQHFSIKKARYNVFKRKAFEKLQLVLPEFNRRYTWIGLDENFEWRNYQFISGTLPYEKIMAQVKLLPTQ